MDTPSPIPRQIPLCSSCIHFEKKGRMCESDLHPSGVLVESGDPAGNPADVMRRIPHAGICGPEGSFFETEETLATRKKNQAAEAKRDEEFAKKEDKAKAAAAPAV